MSASGVRHLHLREEGKLTSRWQHWHPRTRKQTTPAMHDECSPLPDAMVQRTCSPPAIDCTCRWPFLHPGRCCCGCRRCCCVRRRCCCGCRLSNFALGRQVDKLTNDLLWLSRLSEESSAQKILTWFIDYFFFVVLCYKKNNKNTATWYPPNGFTWSRASASTSRTTDKASGLASSFFNPVIRHRSGDVRAGRQPLFILIEHPAAWVPWQSQSLTHWLQLFAPISLVISLIGSSRTGRRKHRIILRSPYWLPAWFSGSERHGVKHKPRRQQETFLMSKACKWCGSYSISSRTFSQNPGRGNRDSCWMFFDYTLLFHIF